PLQWPIPEANKVYMYPEDTHHYALSTPEGIAEWQALVPYDGTVRPGPRARPSTIAMSHQLQCLDVIRNAMVLPISPGDAQGRNARDRCLNHTTQMVLRHAHAHVESARTDVTPRITDLTRSVHRCRDWRVPHDRMERSE
ncbi:hypothetical protein HETIRDRAFT_243407, partial [Heterobasidion irregulare TC 32-1]